MSQKNAQEAALQLSFLSAQEAPTFTFQDGRGRLVQRLDERVHDEQRRVASATLVRSAERALPLRGTVKYSVALARYSQCK